MFLVQSARVRTAVLIVNYRGYGDLDRCLESLGPHLRDGDEVIVVDNESDERQLGAVVQRYLWIRPIARAENLGFAAAVNLAARHTGAEFLWLLNPDTIVEGPALESMREWLLTHPETFVAGPRVLNRDGSIQPSARRFPGLSTILGGRSTWLSRHRPNNWWTRRNLLGVNTDGPLEADWIAGSCLMTRRSVFEALGGLDERFFLYWEDADYCRRVTRGGGRCTYLPLAAVRHLCGGSAKYNLPRAVHAFHESAFQLYWKHTGLPGKLAAPFVWAALAMRSELVLARARRDRGAPAEPVDTTGHGRSQAERSVPRA